MDWATTVENISGQGYLFWSATAAVALGVTLILTSGFIQVRRWRSRAQNSTSSLPSRKAEITPCATQPNSIAENVLTIENAYSLNAFSAGQANPRGIDALTARLRAAADRLADYQAKGGPRLSVVPESHLKDANTRVDYLFRAGKG